MLFLTASLAFCLSSQSDPDCLSSVLTLALLPSVGESFTKLLLVGGGGSGCPHRSEYRGRGCSAYYTSLLPLLSLSLSSHVSLPLHPTKSPHFYLIHSLIRPPPFATLSNHHTSPPPLYLCISVEHILILN